VRYEKCKKNVVGNPEGKGSLGRPRRRWRVILEWTLGKYGGKMWTGFISLTIGTSGGLLCTR
jgi:hypothetical protein